MADEPEWGVDFESGEITRPTPEVQTDTDTELHAFDDEPAGQDPPPQRQSKIPDSVPRHRLDELNTRLREAEAREQKYVAMLERMTARQPPAPGPQAPGPTLSEAEQTQKRLQAQIYSLVPGLEDLVKNRERLAAAADAIPRIQGETSRYWGTVADHALRDVATTLSAKMGGELPPSWKNVANQAFSRFVSSDPTRQARYEAQDQSIVTEFAQVFEQEYLAPARRQQQAAQRVDQTRRLPVAGRTSPPPSAPIPKPNMDNEDEVFANAWSVIQNARQGMTP